MKNLSILVILITFLSSINAQKTAYELLDQRLEDLRKDSRNLELQRDKYVQKVKDLQNENIRLRSNAVLYRKDIERNETVLKQVIQNLFDTQNLLMVKIADVSVLTQQIGILQSEKDSLKNQLTSIANTDTRLKRQLDSAKAQIASISSDFEALKDEAKYESLEASFRNPKGHRNKLLSVVIAEGGLINFAQGFTSNVSAFTYISPSRNLLGGLSLGIDFYDTYSDTGFDSSNLLITPLMASFRGNFGPQDFFSLKKDTASFRFNINWIFDFGWGFVIKDTDASKSFNGNAVMSGGVGTLWPSHKNFGIGTSVIVKVQRAKEFDTSGFSDAVTFPMFIMKISFYLR